MLADSDLIKSQPQIVDWKETIEESTKENKKKSRKTEKIILSTEADSKVYKLFLYKEAISDPMHIRQ